MRFLSLSICLLAASILVTPLAHAGTTSNGVRYLLPLIDGTGRVGGAAFVAVNATDFLKVFVLVWRLTPNTLHTVWIADCTAQGPPGDYPCPAGGALNDGPGVFGTNSPSCPAQGEGGPLTFVRTNAFGFGVSRLVVVPLAGVAYPGIHYAHVMTGLGCVPAPAYPAGFYSTRGFNFTISGA